MSRSPDIMFMAEYIKSVLFFATVRDGKTLKSSSETHYFCIDDDLIYENYYSDFGPLNLGCVYKYCQMVNDKLKQYFNKQRIVHYTSIDPKQKANSAFLLGCYGVLYLSLHPKDALKPLMVHGQSYRPFQDATPGDSDVTISVMDCLLAISKAKSLGFFNFDDFNYEEYDRLDKIQGGDLNWIVPGKFLAFIGPVDFSVSLYHPPEMYINYFLDNNVKIVIRLNKKLYDGNVFNNSGINHYDLFFPDGSCPPRHILMKFLKIAEESKDAIAVHCKAGLGRTGSLIGCYLIKHYRMTSHEAIGWMRICRPGSVIGHQQEWLEQLEAWLLKQGNIYRKHVYNDTDKVPYHDFGVYSIAQSTTQQRPANSQRPLSPLPTNRQAQSNITPPIRPQDSRIKDSNMSKKEPFEQWRMRPDKISSLKCSQNNGRDQSESRNIPSRRGSGAGDPRALKTPSRSSNIGSQSQKYGLKTNETSSKNYASCFNTNISTFRTTNGPMIKNVNDARNFLLRSSKYNEEREKQLLSSVIVTPHTRPTNFTSYRSPPGQTNIPTHILTPSTFSTESRGSTQPSQYRRRLGRSPSPVQTRMSTEKTRATNTSSPQAKEKLTAKTTDSKTALRAAISRLKISSGRDGSIGKTSVGVASLGARRDAPSAKRAPSVRSDERPIATQGDLLNSIKFQRRFRDVHATNSNIKDKASIKSFNCRTTTVPREGISQDINSRDKPPKISKNFFGPTRPSSPKGRRSPHASTFH